MKLKFLLLALPLFSQVESFSQTFQWADRMGGTSNDYGNTIAVDATGNVYTAGYFNGTADFNPGAPVVNLVSLGLEDAFVSKVDASGNFVWAIQIAGTLNDRANSIAVDATGNLYLTGSFDGTCDFDPTAGTANLTSAGASDIFIMKISPAGALMWVQQFGSTAADFGYGIALDGIGDVYTTGPFQGTVDFDPSGATVNLISAGSNDIFISKLDGSGNFIWAKKMGGVSSDISYGIDVDGSGNVYTTGQFAGTADFNPGGTVNNLVSPGGSDIFVSKLDVAGNYVWAVRMGGTSSEQGKAIVIDPLGFVYSTGKFAGTGDFNPGGPVSNLVSAGSDDIYISKLDAAGNFVYAKQQGGTGVDNGLSIAIDINGDIYNTGLFSGTVDFDPNGGVTSLVASGGNDMFVSKLSAAGNLNWAYRIGGPATDASNGIFLNSAGNIYMTGYYSGTTDFNVGVGTNNLTSATPEIFVLKMAQCLTTYSTMSATACDSYVSPSTTYIWTTTGVYNDTLTNVAGCDSVITVTLTINNSNTSTQNITACDSYTWSANATNYLLSGTYMTTLTNVAGCDSVATLNLTINNSTTGSETITACDDYFWTTDGNTYSVSGAYIAVLTNSVGCDSTVTLNLTINNSTSGSETITACDNYLWSADGNTYSSGGTYIAIVTNSVGCDSTVTLNLTINNSTTGSETITACDNYFWSTDGNTYSASGAYVAVLTNSVGCDSTVTLNLTIKNSTTGSEIITACASYLWPTDGNTYSTSGAYIAVLTNSVGCDSTVTLTLTINSSTVATQTATACDSYLWTDDGNTYNASGAYITTLTNSVGCDSTITLNLTINTSNTGFETIVACDTYTWITDGNTYTASGAYNAVLTNIAGCDSTVTLNLTIGSIDTAVTQGGATFTSSDGGAIYQWIDCGNGNAPIVGETSQNYIATVDGSYAVIVSEGGCLDTSYCYSIFGVGFDEFQKPNLVVYPNPSNGSFTVVTESNNSDILTVTDSKGTLVATQKIISATTIIDLSNLESGIYFLRIDSQIVKLIKQ